MPRMVYVNGRYTAQHRPQISVEDRGFQFADSVYEVWAVAHGRLLDAEGHFARLERSLGELRIRPPMGRAALQAALRETLRRNHVSDGIVYLQITRGAAPRDHAFPSDSTSPTVVITARRHDPVALARKADVGVEVITVPETRWARCDIKTVGLLPNALAKQFAREAGAAEAWFVDEDGLITEGASTNAWIVDDRGVLRTRGAEANILRGVTRNGVLAIAPTLQLSVEERPFSVAEARTAREAFYTAASAFVTPVVRIDGVSVGEGRPGPVTRRLRELYLHRAHREVA